MTRTYDQADGPGSGGTPHPRGPVRGVSATLGQGPDAGHGGLHVAAVLLEAAGDDALLLVGHGLDGRGQPRRARSQAGPLAQPGAVTVGLELEAPRRRGV